MSVSWKGNSVTDRALVVCSKGEEHNHKTTKIFQENHKVNFAEAGQSFCSNYLHFPVDLTSPIIFSKERCKPFREKETVKHQFWAKSCEAVLKKDKNHELSAPTTPTL